MTRTDINRDTKPAFMRLSDAWAVPGVTPCTTVGPMFGRSAAPVCAALEGPVIEQSYYFNMLAVAPEQPVRRRTDRHSTAFLPYCPSLTEVFP